MIKEYLNNIVDFLHSHDVKIVKDIIVPTFSLDKIIALIGLYYIIKTFVSSYKLSRVNFLYNLTQSHRDIWSKILSLGKTNILDPKANPESITPEEEWNLIFLILNLKVSYEAHCAKIKRLSKQEIIDIGEFYTLPLPNHVWEKIKRFHEKDFILFVENAKQSCSDKKSSLRGKLIFLLGDFYNRLILSLSSLRLKILRRIKSLFKAKSSHAPQKKNRE